MAAGGKAGSAGPGYRDGRTDGPTKCPWHVGIKEPSPHTTDRPTRGKVLSTVLEAVGETPLVRLDKLAKAAGLKCTLLAKCEFMNAGGSVKDRIGRRMVEDAEKSGRIKPGDTLIEPTSGNTGIGIALAAAVKGYKCIITMPEKMSAEKVSVLKALGASIVRTPTEAAFDSPESHISVAQRLNREIPNSHILDQYTNPGNPLAHYDGTAEEILDATDGKVDMVVVGTGTGGTLTGIARKMREKAPSCIVVGVDPKGSILAEPDELNEEGRLKPYLVEGTGYDFIPAVLDRALVDRWVKTTDEDSFITARRLIAEEGLLCGGSSGGNVWAALQEAKDLSADQTCVVILPDSIRNYLSKFAADDWMWEHGFVDKERGIGVAEAAGPREWWESLPVASLDPAKPVSVSESVTCQEAIDILDGEAFNQLPVVKEDGSIAGIVTEGNLTAKLMSRRLAPTDPVKGAVFPQFRQVTAETPLSTLARIFDKDHYALVVTTNRLYHGGGKEPTLHTVVTGIVTRIDLLKFIAKSAPPAAADGAAAGEGSASA